MPFPGTGNREVIPTRAGKPTALAHFLPPHRGRSDRPLICPPRSPRTTPTEGRIVGAVPAPAHPPADDRHQFGGRPRGPVPVPVDRQHGAADLLPDRPRVELDVAPGGVEERPVAPVDRLEPGASLDLLLGLLQVLEG